jgi:hypothetical protein
MNLAELNHVGEDVNVVNINSVCMDHWNHARTGVGLSDLYDDTWRRVISQSTRGTVQQVLELCNTDSKMHWCFRWRGKQIRAPVLADECHRTTEINPVLPVAKTTCLA